MQPYLLTHPVLSPWGPRLDGAGLVVLLGGGVTAEEVEPAAVELPGVIGPDAEGDKLVPEVQKWRRTWIVGLLWQYRWFIESVLSTAQQVNTSPAVFCYISDGLL